MSVDSYILDVIIGVKGISKRDMPIANQPSIETHVCRGDIENMSTTLDLTSSTSTKTSRSSNTKRKLHFENSELSLNINLCGATMATTNKTGAKIYETTDQSIIGRQICIEPSGREDGSGT